MGSHWRLRLFRAAKPGDPAKNHAPRSSLVASLQAWGKAAVSVIHFQTTVHWKCRGYPSPASGLFWHLGTVQVLLGVLASVSGLQLLFSAVPQSSIYPRRLPLCSQPFLAPRAGSQEVHEQAPVLSGLPSSASEIRRIGQDRSGSVLSLAILTVCDVSIFPCRGLPSGSFTIASPPPSKLLPPSSLPPCGWQWLLAVARHGNFVIFCQLLLNLCTC